MKNKAKLHPHYLLKHYVNRCIQILVINIVKALKLIRTLIIMAKSFDVKNQMIVGTVNKYFNSVNDRIFKID